MISDAINHGISRELIFNWVKEAVEGNLQREIQVPRENIPPSAFQRNVPSILAEGARAGGISGTNAFGSSISGTNAFGSSISGTNAFGSSISGTNAFGSNISGTNISNSISRMEEIRARRNEISMERKEVHMESIPEREEHKEEEEEEEETDNEDNEDEISRAISSMA